VFHGQTEPLYHQGMHVSGAGEDRIVWLGHSLLDAP
jgi:hypothetical protein